MVLGLLICLGLLLIEPLHAEEESYLYIVTKPLGAMVYLDDVRQDRPGPLLLRGLEPGSYKMRIEKEGWYPSEVRLELPRDRTIDVALVPREPLVYMDGRLATTKAETPVSDAGDSAVRLTSDGFILSPGAHGISVTPIFRGQRLLDGVKFALPLFLGLSAVLTVREIYAPRDSTFLLAPELAASSLLGGGLLVWNIVLESKRNRFYRNYRIQTESWEKLSLAARLRFDAAAEALLGGNFDAALAQFRTLTQEYPDDPVMPHALFEIGRILFIRQDLLNAVEVYRTIAEDYPLPDLHDRSRKGLADCLAALGDTRGALEQLDLLTFNGSGLTREEVRLYRDLF